MTGTTGIREDKRALLETLEAKIRSDLDLLERSQADTKAAATHEENRAEHAKDTRATEQSYLARGLAKRVEELRRSLDVLSGLALRSFEPDDEIGVSALVTLRDESHSEAQTWWLLPVAGGIEIETGDGGAASSLRTITPGTPLGRALLGRSVGDSETVETPRGPKHFEILEVR